MPGSEGGLGAGLVGEKITINSRQVAVMKLLGEGEFRLCQYGGMMLHSSLLCVDLISMPHYLK